MTIEELRSAADAAREQVASRIADFSGTLFENVTDRVDNATATLVEVKGAAESLRDRLANVNEQLVALSQSIEQVEETIEGTFVGFTESISEVDGKLEEFTESIEESLEQALDKIAEFRDAMTAAVDELIAKTVETIQRIVSEPLFELRDQSIEKLEKFITDWTEGLMPDKLSEIQGEWMAELKSELDELIEELVSGLDGFRNELLGKSESSGRNREESNAMQELLDQALQPVIGELQRVSSLASSVGISIG